MPFHIEDQDTYSVVKKLIPEGKTMCSLCSRLRRGILYRVAGELGATKIALGHHRDDMVVTLLINMFFGGRLKGMPPKLVSDDGRNVVIRPLAYVAETDLERWAEHRQFPIIPCTLCGSQDNLQRVQIKQMMREWERQYPGRIDNMLHAMGNVVPSHLMDRKLYPFTTLKATGVADAWWRQGVRRRALCTAVDARRIRSVAATAGPLELEGVDDDILLTWLTPDRRHCCWPAAPRLSSVSSEVSSHGDWPAGRAPGTYAFDRLPSQQALAAAGRACEAARARALLKAGFQPAAEGQAPTCWCRSARAHRVRRHAALGRPDVVARRLRLPTVATAAWMRLDLAARLGLGRALRPAALPARGGAADPRPASGQPLFEARASSEGVSTLATRCPGRDVRGRADGLPPARHQPAARRRAAGAAQ